MSKAFLIGLLVLALIAITTMIFFPEIILWTWIVSAVAVLIWSNINFRKMENKYINECIGSNESFDVKFFKEQENETMS